MPQLDEFGFFSNAVWVVVVLLVGSFATFCFLVPRLYGVFRFRELYIEKRTSLYSFFLERVGLGVPKPVQLLEFRVRRDSIPNFFVSNRLGVVPVPSMEFLRLGFVRLRGFPILLSDVIITGGEGSSLFRWFGVGYSCYPICPLLAIKYRNVEPIIFLCYRQFSQFFKRKFLYIYCLQRMRLLKKRRLVFYKRKK